VGRPRLWYVEVVSSPGESAVSVTSVCPPDLALAAIEMTISPKTLQQFKLRFASSTNVVDDNVYNTWKYYKQLLDTLRNDKTADKVEPDDGQTQLATAKPGHFPFQNSSSPGLTYNNTLQSRSMFLLLSNDVIFDNN
jgi:hypothetical protein